ncbi:hypothetical protein Q5M87_14110, partial [Brachyspira innocens]|uniref:hypothetical protein n=1 Tax=Brachyspira innocens TaxID=13264 RepID=UPI0026F11CE4
TQLMTGEIRFYNTYEQRIIGDGTGCFYMINGVGYSPTSTTGALDVSKGVAFRNDRQVRTATETRVRNRLIRVYRLLTINGKTVSQIMAGV